MAKFKTPGQKRKSFVRGLCIALFLVITLVGTAGFEYIFADALKPAWKESYTPADAVVTSKEYAEEEYVGRKGKTKTRDVYTLYYQFNAGGQTVEGSTTISESDYLGYSEGDAVAVGYDGEEPYLNNDTVANIQKSNARNIHVQALTKVAPVSGSVAYVLYLFLLLTFVRESKDAMPEGFFTENSWLDVDDGYLVAVADGVLQSFKIDKKKVAAVQDAYQSGADFETLKGLAKASKLISVPLNEVTGIESAFNSDVLTIHQGDDDHSFEFLNRAMKAHALNEIKKYLPEALSHQRQQKARIMAALPSIIVLSLLLALIVYFDNVVAGIIVGVFAVYMVLPKTLSHLLNPYIVDTWSAPKAA